MLGRILLLLCILCYLAFYGEMGEEYVEEVRVANLPEERGRGVREDKRSRKARETASEENVEEYLKRIQAFVNTLDLPEEGSVATDEVMSVAEDDFIELNLVLRALYDQTSDVTDTPTPVSDYGEQRYAPCEPPFSEIAYRMCILQEVTLKLSWDAAQDYCWEHGAELAKDSVVIKTRRFLNDLYGEDGSRVRWPIWVGGKKIEEGVWRWCDGSEVPKFLWAGEEPRDYPPSLIPQGSCMILDGYQRFYGASLPCHLKRRFVCQRRD